ncbi:MAG: ABC transporter ATP-binding protein [Candidatus Hydrogenedentes bacterium]|nr:ABC transporter ATP-binding protein [Candidatus Hydrogenedentota bacterium]
MVLSIRNLRTYFHADDGVVRAVDGVDLDVPRGATVGIVGESGCGKSVTAFSILKLIAPPGRIESGRVVFYDNGRERVLSDMSEDGPDIRQIRGKAISMVFQEPMSSLSPVHSVGNQIVEAITLHTALRGRTARDRATAMLERVGIPDAPRRFRQYPHELSGGMRQRVMIAMALACEPALLIADEPTTALDVTIQAQILELMRELQADLGMAILLITHDLGVIAEAAQEVAVMYLGRIVEQGRVNEVLDNPQHPYTRALLQSIPTLSRERKVQLRTIAGSLPDPLAQIAGCPFHTRCVETISGRCDHGGPPGFVEIAPGRKAACFARERERERT